MLALAGTRVLDFTDATGVWAGRLLADLGADVVQVERGAGTDARTASPSVAGPEGARMSFLWESYGLNKRSLCLPDDDAEGNRVLESLLAGAGFVLTTGGADTLVAQGLDYAALQAINPSVVHASITPYGLTAPSAHCPSTDLTLSAVSGSMARNRFSGRRPIRISSHQQACLHACADAVTAMLIAHYERDTSGLGQHIDISIAQSFGLTSLKLPLYGLVGDVPPDPSREASRSPLVWATIDGYVHFTMTSGPATGHFSNRFCEWMADLGAWDPAVPRVDWTTMPQTSGSGLSNGAGTRDDDGWLTPGVQKALDESIEKVFAGLTKQEVFAVARRRRLLIAPIYNAADVLADKHFAARGVWTPWREGEARLPGPFAVTTPPLLRTEFSPAPELGAHTDEVLAELATSSAPEPTHVPVPGSGDLPLAGVKVLDFSWVLAGPLASRVLADFGATVVRIEAPRNPDLGRYLGPFKDGSRDPDSSVLAMDAGAGKFNVSLDLATPEGREVAERLVDWADVVMDSFSPGVLGKWGFDYETVAARRPEIIMLSSCLLGQRSPYTGVAGFGSAGGALSGTHFLTGWPDLSPAGFAGPYTDFTAPRFAAISVLAALIRRRRTGQGTHIDLAQADSSLQFVAPELLSYQVTGVMPSRHANEDDAFLPNDTFETARTRDTDEFVAVSVRDDDDWRALVTALELTSALPPGAANWSLAGRGAHAAELDDVLRERLAALTAAAAVDALTAAGVPASVVGDYVTLATDPDLVARGHFVRLPHPRFGEVVVESSRMPMSRTPAVVTRAGGRRGQDNEAVLRDILGYAPEQIAALRAAGAVIDPSLEENA